MNISDYILISDMESTITEALCAEVHSCVDAYLDTSVDIDDSTEFSNLRDAVHNHVAEHFTIGFKSA